MKKAYEVVVAVTGYKNRARTVFVEAESKRQVAAAYDIKRVFTRPDMKPEDCPCEIIDDVIISK